MARPIKNNADYFPHDADMRNDPRIKALRRKFGIEGYGTYAMLLEFLTDSEYFELKNTALSMELVAGDFDIDPAKLSEILQYCFQLDLFQLDPVTNIISCKSLDNRLEPLLSKRKRDRIELPTAITPQNGVIDSESTQSKVKESKVKESKNYTFNYSIALLLNKPYQLPKDRGMEMTGRDVDDIVEHLRSNGWSEIRIETVIKAMKASYQIKRFSFPTKQATLLDSIMGTDWIGTLRETDPTHIAENIAKEKRNGKQRTAEPDTIGTSEPGSLG